MEKQNTKIRQPAFAGSFYPADQKKLRATVLSFLNAGQSSNQKPLALVVPHAGYLYSGAVAGKTFSCLSGHQYKKVLLIGPSHNFSFKGLVVDQVEGYQTPLGLVKVSDQVKQLIELPNFLKFPEAFAVEHDLEVELPFLQTVLPQFKLIPLLAGNQNSLIELKAIAEQLKKLIDQETLVVASVDFTHYGPNYGFLPFTDQIEENLSKLDQPVIDYLSAWQTDQLYRYLNEVAVTNDGQAVLTMLAEIYQDQNCRLKTIARETSAKTSGDFTNCVCYAGLLIVKKTS